MPSNTAEKTKSAAQDSLWRQIRDEAEKITDTAPVLAPFIKSQVLSHATLEQAVVHRVAARLDHIELPVSIIVRHFDAALQAAPEIGAAFRADLEAAFERDAACNRLIEPLLYFKGYAALQAQRLAHWLWQQGRKDIALYLQSRMSVAFGIDIHPGAKIGSGVLLDHATGFVAGETVVIGDDVSIFQNVTLGGSSAVKGSDRHPKIGHGVLIGAGAKILGNITVGECARVAAGSVVLGNVPAHKTVAGIPARVVGDAGCKEPAKKMDQYFDYTI